MHDDMSRMNDSYIQNSYEYWYRLNMILTAGYAFLLQQDLNNAQRTQENLLVTLPHPYKFYVNGRMAQWLQKEMKLVCCLKQNHFFSEKLPLHSIASIDVVVHSVLNCWSRCNPDCKTGLFKTKRLNRLSNCLIPLQHHFNKDQDARRTKSNSHRKSCRVD